VRPELKLEILKRSYSERGRVVSDLERITCGAAPLVEQRTRYEFANHNIVRVWQRRWARPQP